MTIRGFFARLRRSRSGVAMTEFALGAPFLLGAGLWGVEIANLAATQMKIGQLAIHIADNASRIGDTSTLEDRKIYESDINDVLIGAGIQGGNRMALYTRGRVIVSSLEMFDEATHCIDGNCPSGSPAQGAQFIHWQRCDGDKVYTSNYGTENQTMPNGMGPVGEEITAEDKGAVIFVEIAYDYLPLVSASFVGSTEIKSTAAFTVRDSRDLSGIRQRNTASPDPIATCS